MASKIILAFCAQVLLVQTILGQYFNGLGAANGLARTGGVGLGGLGTAGGSGWTGGFGASNGLGWNGGLGAAGGIVNGLGNGIAVTGTPVITANPTYLNLDSVSAGGVLPITSFGPIVPVGLTVVSDNVIDGAVTLQGQLPFLSAVAFEGALPTGGSGLTQCGCGSAGNIGIVGKTVGSAVTDVAPVTGVAGTGLGGVGFGRGRAGLWL